MTLDQLYDIAVVGGGLCGFSAAIRAAKAIGPIDYGDGESCEPLDVLKHLTSDYLKKKLEA